MSRFTIISIAIGIILCFLSTLRIEIFTWKDTHKLERLVVTTRHEGSLTDYPVYPEELKKDERLSHQEGLSGLGTFGVNKIKDCFPPQSEDAKDAENDQQVNIPRSPHSVSKPTAQNVPVAEPALPETQEVASSASVGTAATRDTLRSTFDPNVTLDVIPRVFEDPGMILLGAFSVDPVRDKDMKYEALVDDFLKVLAQFDLLAVQGMVTRNSGMFERLVSEVSRRTGRPYKYAAVFPTYPVSQNDPVPVFFYDSNVLEMDPDTVQLVGQPNTPFAFPPLAAKFRVKKAPAEQAFTFIAVNMQMFPGYESQEFQYVPNMITRLKDSASRGNFDREDDVIIFGAFHSEPAATIVGDSRFNQTITWANPSLPTNTFGEFSYISENILFQTQPLAEYTGTSGIWDLRKQTKKTRKIPFDHHPVWACFGICEGASQQSP